MIISIDQPTQRCPAAVVLGPNAPQSGRQRCRTRDCWLKHGFQQGLGGLYWYVMGCHQTWDQGREIVRELSWLVVTGTWMALIFPFTWEFHHPNWRSLHHFSEGLVAKNHQPGCRGIKHQKPVWLVKQWLVMCEFDELMNDEPTRASSGNQRWLAGKSPIYEAFNWKVIELNGWIVQ